MLYNESDIALYDKKIRNNITIISIFSFCILVALVFLGIFTNDNNAKIFKIISLCLALIAGFIDIYIIIENILGSNKKKKLLREIFYSPKSEFEALVVSNDKKITVCADVYTLQIELANNKNQIVYGYWNLELGNNPFKLDQKYYVTLSNSFIIDYRKVNEDE